jgi:hypothetical protein
VVNEGVESGKIIEVAIGPGTAAGRFRVEVIRSPAGEATEEIELDPGALLARRRELQYALLASAVPTRRYLSETEQSVREVGEALYAALLGTGEVASRYRSSAAIAQLHEQGLRLSVRIDTPELAGLPWEAMYDRSADSYVCLLDQVVRRVNVASPPPPLTVRPPLRILGIVSAPRGLPALDAEKERDLLTRALARPISDGLASVTWAPTATWADLQDLLLSQQWHVLHFIGHGDFDPVQDEGVLVLTDELGRPDPVEANRFTDLLREARPRPRLVVLNSCSGAAVGVSDLFSGTAAALVRGGVSAVAAMQYEISDAASSAFSRGFYSAIAYGRGVDDAVSSGRRAIRGTSGRTLEWLTPVLYLRGDETQLFTVSAGDTQIPAPAPTPIPAPAPAPAPAPDDQLYDPWAVLDRPSAGPEPPGRTVSEVTAATARSSTGFPPRRFARALTGHGNSVTSVAFSPDSGYLATGSRDQTVRLWNPATGELVRTLTGHNDSVFGVTFSPAGAWLATCSSDQTSRVMFSRTGRLLRVIGQKLAIRGVAFSPDEVTLATACLDHTAILWDISTGKPSARSLVIQADSQP